MRNIYCKSSIDFKQLDARKHLKKSGIELQLLGDFVESPKDTIEYVKSMGEHIKDIKVVHIPLKSGEELVEVQMLSEQKQQLLFNRVCELAQAISTINNKTITVVIHNGWSLNEYEYSTEKYIKIKKYLNNILDINPGIKIAIENVVPYTPTGNGDFRNGSFPDYVEFIKKLRLDMNTERIGSVLDTCHAIVTIKINSILNSVGKYSEEISIEDYYKANKDICMLVHLCNVEELGYKKGQHGTAFDNESKDLLELLITLHKKYIPNTDITIEVLEDNYTKCNNYIKTRELFDEIIKNNK